MALSCPRNSSLVKTQCIYPNKLYLFLQRLRYISVRNIQTDYSKDTDSIHRLRVFELPDTFIQILAQPNTKQPIAKQKQSNIEDGPSEKTKKEEGVGERDKGKEQQTNSFSGDATNISDPSKLLGIISLRAGIQKLLQQELER